MSAYTSAQYRILQADYRGADTAGIGYAAAQTTWDGLGITDPSDPAQRAAIDNYVTTTGVTLADALNTSNQAAPDANTILVADLYNLIDDTEGDLLTGTDRQDLTDLFAIAGGNSVDVSPGSKARRKLLAIFPPGPTRTAIAAVVIGLLQTRCEALTLPPAYPALFERLAKEGM